MNALWKLYQPGRGIISIAIFMTLAGCRKTPPTTEHSSAAIPAVPSLIGERSGFTTRLTKQNSGKKAPAAPPDGVFQLVHYPSSIGDLAAYLSPDPGDGKKHPLVIWLAGGFSNAISGLAWEDDLPAKDDQSAGAYRKAGLPMMYPSRRGANGNPACKEGLYGEVDDVIAAAEYASQLPWVDANRIYLGGHSTGGTLALLVAEFSEDRFRAVIALGPVANIASYGQDNLPFDVKNARECRLRSPLEFLNTISVPTFIIEGTEMPANVDSFDLLKARGKNPRLTFLTATEADHYSVLAPTNALFAAKIAADTTWDCELEVSDAELKTALVHARDAELLQAGNLQDETGVPGVVFYYPNDPRVDPRTALEQAIGRTMKGVPVVSRSKDGPAPPFIVMQEEKAPFERFPLPDDNGFKFAGRGMQPIDIQAIRNTKTATAIWLVAPRDQIWKLNRAFNELCLDYARQTDAYIWDSPTRECFQRDTWKTTRIDRWAAEGIPDLRSQITIHNYPREDGSGKNRLITLGMEKFGLPDVVSDEVLSSETNPQGHLINAVCQQLASDPIVTKPEEYPVDLETLKPQDIRSDLKAQIIRSGTGKAMLTLMKGTREDGDPDNLLLELDFRHGKGTGPDERSASLLAELWGMDDNAIAVHHDARIKAASREARIELATWKARFQKGLPPGSRLEIKAPFTRDDGGHEYMWIEVLRWTDDDVLHGTLDNNPNYIKALKAGSKVYSKLPSVSDYIVYFPDGSTAGNKTQKLLDEQVGADPHKD